jgi:hypothetical protein
VCQITAHGRAGGAGMKGRPDERPTPNPPLCERCWFPLALDEPVRRRVTQDGDDVVLVGFEHADRTCTPQKPTTEDDAA